MEIDQGYIIRNAYRLDHDTYPVLKAFFVTGMLTRDLFAVAIS